MRSKALTAAFLAMALLGGAATARQRPDLSGTWVATKEAAQGVEAAPSPVLGQRFALRQDGTTLTVLRAGRDETIVATFPLSGGETRFRVSTGLCRGDAEYIESAAWEGSTLALARTGIVPPGGGEIAKQHAKILIRQDAPDRVVVQGTMSRAGEPRAVATVYKRSDEAMPAPDAGVNVKKAPATIASVAWIAGTWIGTTTSGSVEERWTPTASGGTLGIGRTLRNTQLSSFEFLCISERGGSLVYTAMPNGRSPATHFTLTGVSDDSATFENPGHDFPKVIRYSRRPDGSLETTISGEGGLRAQSFVLKRQP
jgi:hypothetical protein